MGAEDHSHGRAPPHDRNYGLPRRRVVQGRRRRRCTCVPRTAVVRLVDVTKERATARATAAIAHRDALNAQLVELDEIVLMRLRAEAMSH